MDDIIAEYPNIKNVLQQTLIEKCNRKGISIDEVVFHFFLNEFRSKTLLKSQACHISKLAYAFS